MCAMLENAGVAEGFLGHEKKTISYGLYSAGSSMALKAAAINKPAYPAMDGGAAYAGAIPHR